MTALTEDSDLSYSCPVKGWKFVLCAGSGVPFGAPVEMHGFSVQHVSAGQRSHPVAAKTAAGAVPRQHPVSGDGPSFMHLIRTLLSPMVILSR